VIPYFQASAKKFRRRSQRARQVVEPRALDDCGSMCAALIRGRLAHLGPDLNPVILTWSDWIGHKQFRLKDGTLARQRPQAQSLWADDAYMGIPALAEMGHLTGDRRWFDDAVKQVELMSAKLFKPADGPLRPRLERAQSGCAAVLLGPRGRLDHHRDVRRARRAAEGSSGREKVLTQLRAALNGVARYQSGSGLWHQMVDRNDSYLETSATAMFTYGLAHAVNEGWISPTTYGLDRAGGLVRTHDAHQTRAVRSRARACTTFAGDMAYYYNRPASVKALHGYGTTMLAASRSSGC